MTHIEGRRTLLPDDQDQIGQGRGVGIMNYLTMFLSKKIISSIVYPITVITGMQRYDFADNL